MQTNLVIMDTKLALLVIFNHRFDKNIPIIDDLYKDKFSHVFHLVPFYDGDKENVIPVYETSYHFQSYISQAYTHLKDKGFTHYFIVADDMLINPKINENNLWDEIGVRKDECMYPSEFWILQQLKENWSWMDNVLHYKVKQKGVEIENILPSRKEAERKFAKFNIPTSKIPLACIYQRPFKQLLFHLPRLPFSRTLDYPLVAGYSDIFMVTSTVMDDFCKYCGAFAATNLFVEAAIPTSLVLASDRIKFDKNLKLHYGALWYDELHKFEEKYSFSLTKLLNEYPEDKLFLHPIKLSKWK